MFDKQTYAMVDRLIRIRFGGSFRDPRERRRFRAIGPIKDKKSAGDAGGHDRHGAQRYGVCPLTGDDGAG